MDASHLIAWSRNQFLKHIKIQHYSYAELFWKNEQKTIKLFLNSGTITVSLEKNKRTNKQKKKQANTQQFVS